MAKLDYRPYMKLVGILDLPRKKKKEAKKQFIQWVEGLKKHQELFRAVTVDFDPELVKNLSMHINWFERKIAFEVRPKNLLQFAAGGV